MNIMSSADAAIKWNISRRRVEVLCSQGRIEGVQRIYNNLMPKTAPQPQSCAIVGGVTV